MQRINRQGAKCAKEGQQHSSRKRNESCITESGFPLVHRCSAIEQVLLGALGPLAVQDGSASVPSVSLWLNERIGLRCRVQ